MTDDDYKLDPQKRFPVKQKEIIVWNFRYKVDILQFR